MITENISDVVHLKSKDRSRCKICGFSADNFETAINHMIVEHEYKLKYVGTETESNDKGLSFHYTIAILGK